MPRGADGRSDPDTTPLGSVETVLHTAFPSCTLELAIGLAFVGLVPTAARAQRASKPPPPSPASMPASSDRPLDRVELVDGTVLTGRLVETRPGTEIVLLLENGARWSVAWTQIRAVKVGGAAQADVGGARVDRVAAGVDMAAGKATYRSEQDCPPGQPPEACRQWTAAGVNAASGTATFDRVRDCAPGAADARCTETLHANAGAGEGLGVSYKKESITAVATRPSSVANLVLGGGLLMATVGDSDTLYGMNLELSLDILAGDTFPDVKGGTWNGFFLNPTTSLRFARSSGSTDLTMWGPSIGVGAGWQYLDFSALESGTLVQSGWGFRLGYSLGYQSQHISVSSGEFGTIESESSDMSHGPVIGLVFPSYNPGTANYESSSLTMLILPTGDSLFVTLSFLFGV